MNNSSRSNSNSNSNSETYVTITVIIIFVNHLSIVIVSSLSVKVLKIEYIVRKAHLCSISHSTQEKIPRRAVLKLP